MPVINLGKRSKRAENFDSPEPEPVTEPEPSQKRPKHDPTSPLCAECQTLSVKLDDYFVRSSDLYQKVRDGQLNSPETPIRAAKGCYYFGNAVPVHRFQDRLRQDATCPLCQFFRSMRVLPDQHEHYKLIALPSSESWLFRVDILKSSEVWDEVADSVFMVVVPDLDWLPYAGHEHTWIERHVPSVGMIYRLHVDLPPGPRDVVLVKPRELGDATNMAFVQELLNICREQHGKACRTRSSQDTVERGFRLIDCESDPPRVDVQPWGTPYAALSYVWGTNPEDQVEWPKTVLDAVAATKGVGVRYLWVDRLCINQSDMDEKSYLISKMATIYESAEVTVVAAAGNGASYGLPGIRSTPRTPQPRYTLDSGTTLVSTLRDPRRDILESTHWTRGWTYQEGILSNRRIVFTENQVYWECRNMAAQESIFMTLFHKPSQDSSDNDEGGGAAKGSEGKGEGEELVMADFMLTGIFKSDAYSGGSLSGDTRLSIRFDDPYRLDYGFPLHLQATLRAQLRGLNEHVRAYSNRRLTKETDALPAFMGITSMYRNSPGLYLLHGLPLWLEGRIDSYSAAQITFAVSACDWYHRRSEMAHKMFVSEPCMRRSHLPSWSWAGWNGPVSWRAPPAIEHCTIVADLIDSIAEGTATVPLWAADLRLSNSAPLRSGGMPTRTLKLQDCDSPGPVDAEEPDLIVLENPHVLKYWRRREDTKRTWQWTTWIGREGGRGVPSVESVAWDQKQYRIAGRLSFIALSVEMTEEEWSAKHSTGELISVLMFAKRWNPKEEEGHGGAHFMTLRKVRDLDLGGSCWERIGVVYLIIPKVSLDRWVTDGDLCRHVPVVERKMVLVIQ